MRRERATQKRGMKEQLLRLTAGFCAALCLFSAVMTGTYAWQSEQHATNDLWGSADTLIPVELTKLEISPTGRPTDIPVAGAVFYLYKADGTQIGVQYVSDQNGKINVQLLPGKYYFEEVAPPYGYTYPLDKYGEPVARHEFEVKEQKEPYKTVEVLVYNRHLSGDLVISKVVHNSDGTPLTDEQREQYFSFAVTFTDKKALTEAPAFASDTDLSNVTSPTDRFAAGDGRSTASEKAVYTYYVNNGPEQTIVSGGTLHLRSGDIAVFEDLPAGLLYNVAEMPVAGYETVSMGHQGNIRKDSTALASFINTCQGGDSGTLVITKEVRGEGADPDEVFRFSLAFGEVTQEFTLKSGGRKAFRVPVGTDYLVRELTEENSAYTPLMDTYSGTIATTKAVELPFINVYEPEAHTKTGALTITKRVERENAETGAKFFTIAVSFQGENAPEIQILQLKAGDSVTIPNIPHGVTYTVMERDAAGYLPAWDAMQGMIVGGQTAEVEVVNTVPEEPQPPVQPDKVAITVTKELDVNDASGNLLPSDYQMLFNMTLYIDGQEKETFALKAGESHTITDIEYGANYEVREENYLYVPDAEGEEPLEQDYVFKRFSQSIVNGSGTATADTEVVVTNTYVGAPRVEISGEKTWVIPEGVHVTLPESIIVRLVDGTTVTAEKEVKPDAEGKWLYTFIAYQNRADGTLSAYAVTEEPVAQFYVSNDPQNVYNLINTYVAPVTEDDPPITIRKKVLGAKAPEVEFTFIFESRTAGAPMPEGALGTKKEFRLLSGQEIEIGKLTFTEEGEYTYAVYEKNDGKKDWSYDTANYTVNYVVTRDKNTHQLSVVRTIKKNNLETASGEMVFTNVYEMVDEGKVLISGVKKWVHRNNPTWNHPTSIVIEVYGDGKRVYQQQLTAADGWRYSLSLDKYAADGHEIVYTVDEQTVSGYSKKIDGYNIINTFIGTVPSVPPSVGPGWSDTPVTPDTPDTPDKPEKEPGSADTGDDSRIPFWFTMTLASMLGCIATIRTIRSGQYVGKRLKK